MPADHAVTRAILLQAGFEIYHEKTHAKKYGFAPVCGPYDIPEEGEALVKQSDEFRRKGVKCCIVLLTIGKRDPFIRCEIWRTTH